MLDTIKKQAYRDGADYILVFRNCGDEDISQINGLFHLANYADADVIPLVAPELKFIDGPYAGMSANEALEKHGNKAFKWLIQSLSDDDEMNESTTRALRKYIKGKYAGVDPYKETYDWSDTKCRSFFKNCFVWITPEMEKTFATGYLDYKTFVNSGLLEQKRSAVAATLEKIQKEEA